VLLVGGSKAGKSRTAYEAARRLTVNGDLHDPRVVVPQGTAAVARLLDLDPSLDLNPPPALLWLDDLTEGELGELTTGLLDRLERRRVRILGTITAQRHDRIEAGDSELGRIARQALDRAAVIRLDSQLTVTEQAAAEAAYPGETFEAGIGEQLVAASELVTRYDNARQGAQPHAWAVVQAAIDWVRMDVGRPIRRSELTYLYPAYLRLIRPTADPVTDLSEPLTEAQKPVGSHIAMLQPTPDPADGEACYRPFDYLVALADGQHDRVAQPILDQTWTQVPHLTTLAECWRVSASAYYRQLPHIARQLLTVLSESGDPEEAPAAAVGLGLLLAEQGDPQGARAAYQQAIDSGHPEQAPAAVNLGLLLAEQGDPQGARAAFQQAIDSGHPKVRLMAEDALAGLSSPGSARSDI
jgi:tetratricopeptide (TPR) repeat protein